MAKKTSIFLIAVLFSIISLDAKPNNPGQQKKGKIVNVTKTKNNKPKNPNTQTKTKNKSTKTKVSYRINATPSSLNIKPDGGYYTIDIDSYPRKWWILSSRGFWFNTDLNGDQLYLAIEKNIHSDSRSGSLTITNGKRNTTISISQEGKQEDYLSVIPTDIYVDSNGGRRELSVSASGEWRVSLSAASWVGLTRSGNLLSLNIRPNTYSNARTDYFEISCGDKKQRINVRQEGRKEDYINTSQSNISVPSYGGTYQIDVSSSGYWTIHVNPYSWGHLSRSGNTLYLTIDPNDNYSTRSDSFILKCGNKTATVRIYQSAKTYSSSSSYSSTSSSTSNWQYKVSGYDLYPRRFWGVSFGYVQKEWTTKTSGYKYHHGLNEASQGLHGIQVGGLYEPYFKFGLGLRTGLFGEYLVNRDDGDMSVIDAEIYIPLHMSFRARFGQFHLFGFGGVGADIGIYSSCYAIVDDHYKDVKNVWGSWLAPDWKRFNASYEFGGGFRYKALQLSFTKSIGFIDMSHTREYRVTQDKPMQINISFMF